MVQMFLYGLLLVFFAWLVFSEIVKEAGQSSLSETMVFMVIPVVFSIAAVYCIFPVLFLGIKWLGYHVPGKKHTTTFVGTIISLRESEETLRNAASLFSSHRVQVSFTDNEDVTREVTSPTFIFFREQPLKDNFLDTYKTVPVRVHHKNETIVYSIDLLIFLQAVILYRWFNPWKASQRYR